jgi:hypothetical protein
MRNSFYKAILCLAGIILFVGTSHAQLGATVAVTNTTCGLNNGSAIVTPTGGSGYTYAWSGGIASVTNTANNIPAGNYTVTVTSAGGIVPIYTETFGPPAPAGWNLLVSSSAATGQTNEAQPNFWAIDDVEGGQAVGACGGAGSATGNGNNHRQYPAVHMMPVASAVFRALTVLVPVSWLLHLISLLPAIPALPWAFSTSLWAMALMTI